MVDTKHHILYIPRWYPSKSDPMLGLFVKNHAKAAIAAGYRITVAYAMASEKNVGSKIRTERCVNGNLNEIIVYYSFGRLSSPFLALTAWYRAIKTALHEYGTPVIIHAHVLTRTGIIALLLSILYGVPYVITEHWSRYYPENKSFRGCIRRLLTRLVIKHASSVTVVSGRLYDAMKGNGLKFKKQILPNVVDINLFDINTNKENKFRFISITCFDEKAKNLKMLIDAAAKHRSAGYDFELILVGDGADREMIQQYSESSGILVTYTGTLSPEQTAAFLKVSHCLVLSSNYETYGIVVYEALASGVPVISTNVADLAELIDDEAGIIIPVDDINALTMAMSSMQENYNKYNPAKLRKKVINICSIDSVANKLNQIYQPLINKP